VLAATGRGLIAQGERQAIVVRLESVRSMPAPVPGRGPGDAVCQLAA
jgi:hypothetical protein